jgi:cyclic-di-GMP phosphodiesterase, flagellum assembly factor TipF
MGLQPMAVLGVAAAIGGALGASALGLAGAPGAAVAVGGLMAAGGAAALAQARTQAQVIRNLEAAVGENQAVLGDLAMRQAQGEAKLAEIERRTIESPALVWRAATADIEVLGSLVSNLAQAVEEHERRLAAMASPAAEAKTLADAEAAAEDAGAPSPLADTAPAPAVIAELRTTLAVALASDRLELCLQPVMALPQRRVRGYEATLRLRGEAGDLQDGADLKRIAAATGLDAELDRVLVERAVQVLRILRARSREASAVCAIAAASLRADAFRLSLETLAQSDPQLADSVTLELADAEFRSLDAAGQDAMRGLAAKGLRFGLARPSGLRFDAAEATASGVRQLKVPAERLLRGGRDGEADIHPADLAEFLRRRGVDLVVSDVETEQDVIEILELAAPLAIGAAFGDPRPVRPEILEPRAVAAAEPAKAPEAAAFAPPPPRVQRQSFRSLLRRA